MPHEPIRPDMDQIPDEEYNGLPEGGAIFLILFAIVLLIVGYCGWYVVSRLIGMCVS